MAKMLDLLKMLITNKIVLLPSGVFHALCNDS